jgi:cytochrome c oxidase subunit 3
MSTPLAWVVEPYGDERQQREAASLGMWVFLATEVLFFGGLFAAYGIARVLHPEGFIEAGRETDLLLGSINTALLLASSLTMALAVRAAQLRRQRGLGWLLWATVTIGALFLAVKGLEYHKEYHEGLVPWLDFRYEGNHPGAARLFFFLYYMLTGLHALHMTIGLGVLGVLAWQSRDGRYTEGWYTPVEVSGLYWHFVDIVWTFIYPLIYLVGRASS